MVSNQYAYLYRFVNSVIFGVLLILGASGIIMLYIDRMPWIYTLHRAAGFSLLFLAPWKGMIILRSLSRGIGKSFDRSVVIFLSILLAILTLVVILLGLLWMWRLGPESVLLQSLIAWHWIAGLLLLPLAAFHAWRRWPKPRKRDFLSRRSFGKILGAAAAGLLVGEMADRLGHRQAEGDRARRFTGSRRAGYYSGNGFPIVGESIQFIELEQWRLLVSGAVSRPLSLSYPALDLRRRENLTATIDCTNGWYAVQNWEGVRLADLLAEAGPQPGAAGVRLRSATGYSHTYWMEEAEQILLATHVTGEVLLPEHGYPLRVVVPGRRGWFWVKWLAEVVVLERKDEVLAGMLLSPAEVLRQWQ